MKIRPLHDRVVVHRVEEEEKTKGGIIIPDTAKEKPLEGKIVAVGNGKISRTARSASSTSRSATRSSSASTRAPRSRSRARST